MSVAMLDVEADALDAAAALVGQPDRVLTVVTDVSDGAAMASAAAEVTARFGDVHLLCNNAGVSITGPLWEMSEHDWDWALGVNLLGVANGIRAFVPGMLAHGDDAHVVNTSSLAGLTPMAHAGIYAATKAAVVAASEVMFHDLRQVGARVGVSVLCPGLVNTKIISSERNRPVALSGTGEEDELPDGIRAYFDTGDDPLDVADRVLRAVRDDEFYVLTTGACLPDIHARNQAIEHLGHPVPPRPEAITPSGSSEPLTAYVPER
jgi:NADP-dependent 3-hydroxy acid dehydrogenase YdfG